jgi:hypothetical protein
LDNEADEEEELTSNKFVLIIIFETSGGYHPAINRTQWSNSTSSDEFIVESRIFRMNEKARKWI